MTQSSPVRTTETSPTHDLVEIVRPYLRGWRGPLLLAGVVAAAGVALNWSWLVAIGVAPFLLSALPCIAMCAMGLCMRGMGNRSCSMSANLTNSAQKRRAKMPRSTFAISIAAATALFASLAVHAEDTKGTRSEPPMMGSGKNNMMGHMGQMSQMMDHCSQMMQGTSNRPNEQWREGTPPAGDRSENKR